LFGGKTSAPAVRNLLLASQALGAVESLLGPLTPTAGRVGQVALRFPLDPEKARSRVAKSEEQWHIDGMNKQESMSGFQLLMGVALSAQPDDECGNLNVWPGEHGRTFEAVRQVAKSRAADPRAAEANTDVWLGLRPHLTVPKQQVKLEPGDVVLAHQKLPHAIGLNRSPNVRYQCYFRLSAADYVPEPPNAHGRVFDGWRGIDGHVVEAASRGAATVAVS